MQKAKSETLCRGCLWLQFSICSSSDIKMQLIEREKSLRHVAMVAKCLDLNKPLPCKYGRKIKTKKLSCVSFLCMIVLRNKMVAHNFLPLFNNANSRLCQERLLSSRNFAPMVTWHHPSPVYSLMVFQGEDGTPGIPGRDGATGLRVSWYFLNEYNVYETL